MPLNKHPELKEGEVFLINIAHSSVFTLLEAQARGKQELELDNLKFQYYRLGNFAYDGMGKFFKGSRPIFVSQREHDQQCAHS